MEKQLPLAITGSTAGKLSRGNSRGRTRTCDPPVNSRLLYQLSYSGMSGGPNIVSGGSDFNRGTGVSEAARDGLVTAYAGLPLLDPRGRTLGTLCAMDTR